LIKINFQRDFHWRPGGLLPASASAARLPMSTLRTRLIFEPIRREEAMATAFTLHVNGKSRSLRIADPETPLLWVLREQLGLTGTKYGCGIALCGACVVHVNGEPVRSCNTPVSQVAGQRITTIEGLSRDGSHPVQKAWIMEEVPQCGYCQSGQIMSAAALLAKNRNPSDAEIEQAMAGHLCTCGTYNRIRKAIHTAAAMMRKGG
jgi:isoquinoline 1-oxidoreductase alpha subunit